MRRNSQQRLPLPQRLGRAPRASQATQASRFGNCPSQPREYVGPASRTRDPPSAEGSSLPAKRSVGPANRALLPGIVRPETFSHHPLLDPVEPRAPHRRSRECRSPGPRNDEHRVPTGPCGQPRVRAQGARTGGSLSRTGAQDTARGPKRAGVRTPERTSACGEASEAERGCRPRVVGALVRRLEKSDRTCTGCSRRRSAPYMDDPAGVAATRADRPGRDPSRRRSEPLDFSA
jgi:hypothetical protein